MKHIFAVQNGEDLQYYQGLAGKKQEKLCAFLTLLKEQYAVTELPRAIVWTDAETATHLISDIPIPAYTNDYRTVFCPDPEVWQEIYLHQLDGTENAEVRRYYETAITEDHVLQILGHEFVHHSDLFVGEAYERGIWFEEGMCEYISRRYFLTEKQFDEEARINALLVELLQERYGEHPLEDFGAVTYERDYAGIFFEYWRSFLAVEQIIKWFDGNVPEVFREYHRWHQTSSNVPLSKWFGL